MGREALQAGQDLQNGIIWINSKAIDSQPVASSSIRQRQNWASVSIARGRDEAGEQN
jgi:exosome complex RNA-binding protein Rrp4